MIKRMVKEYKFGKMVQFMKDIGYVIKHKVKVDYIMLMVIFMMGYIFNINLLRIGKIINQKVMVFIYILMVLVMKEDGIMIYKMVMV